MFYWHTVYIRIMSAVRQVALVLALCLYAVIGGFIFQHLESTNEMEECRQGEAKYLPMENETIYKMWSISYSFRSPDDKQVWRP